MMQHFRGPERGLKPATWSLDICSSGKRLKRVPLPLGEGAAKRRVRAGMRTTFLPSLPSPRPSGHPLPEGEGLAPRQLESALIALVGAYDFADGSGCRSMTHEVHSHQYAFRDLQWSLLRFIRLVPSLDLRALFSQETYNGRSVLMGCA